MLPKLRFDLSCVLEIRGELPPQKQFKLHPNDTHVVNFRAREGGTGNMEAIQDEDDMRLVWSHVSDGKLELWCFGKE